MATAARAVALKTETRAGETARASKIVGNFSVDDNSLTNLRLQRLRLLGIIGQRARLLSDLAWEAAR